MATLKVTNIKNESFAGDQLYLKSNGYLGIGTTNPGEELEVSADAPSIQLLSTNASGRKYGFQSMNDGKFGIYDGTAGENRIVIASDGRVGIGTASPTSKIDIHCGSDNTGLQITSTDAGAFASYFDNTGASTIGHSGTNLTLSCDPAGSVGSSNIVFQIDSNNERMRITSDGRVFIGHTSTINSYGVNSRLQVSGTDYPNSSIGIRRDVDSAGAGAVIFSKSRGSQGGVTVVQSGDSLGEILWAGADGTDANPSAGAIVCKVDGTPGSNDMPGRLEFYTTADGAGGVGEKMRLDNTGKLLLGDVNTAWNATSNGYKMTIKESSNENGAIMFMDTDSMAGGVAGVAKGTNQIVSGTSNVDGVFGSFYSHTHLIAGDTINVANAAIRLTVHTEGHVEILDGDLQVASGHGIDFSDTAGSGNSELLNDYEHGNWVPTSASGGWTVSNTYSKYVKIGNLVHLQMYIGLSGTGSSSNLEFGGMPFATAGNGYSVGTVDFGEGGIKGTYMRTKSSSSSLSFLYPSENTSSNRLNLAANQVGDSYVIATITYAVDGT